MDGPPALAERKEEKIKKLSFPPGQSDEFSSLKAEGRLMVFGSALEPLEPERLEATGTSPLCVQGELTADEVAGRHLYR